MVGRFELLERAERILAAPPGRSHIVRPPALGDRLARCVLPLELCRPQNRTRHGQAWELEKLKRSLFLAMLAQVGRRRDPLPGRPQVLCVRFSATEPDKYADWAKHAVDVLCAPTERAKNRLGWLRDDRPKYAEIQQWWEPESKGQGFVHIEVRSGES